MGVLEGHAVSIFTLQGGSSVFPQMSVTVYQFTWCLVHEDGYRHFVYKLTAEYFRIVKRTLKKMRSLKKTLTREIERERERAREREQEGCKLQQKMGQTRETRQNPKTVDSGDGRRSISWLQGFQASPAHPYDRNITEIKMLERQKQCFEKRTTKF